jgi:Calcineurin-like phosphoesterase
MKSDLQICLLQRADVSIHCGDLPDGSKLEVFRTTIQLLKDIHVPLKLGIAGNHDFTMEIPAFEKKVAETAPALDPPFVVKEYGAPREARQLFD